VQPCGKQRFLHEQGRRKVGRVLLPPGLARAPQFDNRQNFSCQGQLGLPDLNTPEQIGRLRDRDQTLQPGLSLLTLTARVINASQQDCGVYLHTSVGDLPADPGGFIRMLESGFQVVPFKFNRTQSPRDVTPVGEKSILIIPLYLAQRVETVQAYEVDIIRNRQPE
jgi:hypothetical protein